MREGNTLKLTAFRGVTIGSKEERQRPLRWVGDRVGDKIRGTEMRELKRRTMSGAMMTGTLVGVGALLGEEVWGLLGQ